MVLSTIVSEAGILAREGRRVLTNACVHTHRISMASILPEGRSTAQSSVCKSLAAELDAVVLTNERDIAVPSCPQRTWYLVRSKRMVLRSVMSTGRKSNKS